MTFNQGAGGISQVFWSVFLPLLAVAFVFAFPVIFADRYYLDDLAHSITGAADWSPDGRPLATLVLELLNFQYPALNATPLIDLSPLPQLLAVVALSIAATILYRNLNRENRDWPSLLVVTPLITSPFLLQNLSYKFDAMPMALAIMSAVAATQLWSTRLLTVAIGAMLLLCAASLYQPSLNVFMGASVLLFLNTARNDLREAFSDVIDNIVKFILGLLFYIAVIAPVFVARSGYSADHSALVSFTATGFDMVADNFVYSIWLASEYFTQTPVLSAAMAIAFLFFIILLVGGKLSAIHRPALFSGITLIVIVAVLFSVFGISLVLQSAVIRPRTLMGFSILLVFLFYAAEAALTHLHPRARLLLVVPLIFHMVIAYGYGAALKAQSQFDAFLFSAIATQLENNGLNPSDRVVFDGKQPPSPILANSARWHMIERMVQLNANNDSEWGYRSLEHFNLKFVTARDMEKSTIAAHCTAAPVYRSQNFDVFKSNGVFIIAFKDGQCFQQ